MKKFIEKIKAALSSENGFTMIELIIVIALIAIIGAMLVPSFTQTTARSRIKTDINGIKTVQNAVNLYTAEVGKSNIDATAMKASTGIVSGHPLITNGYLEEPNVQAGGKYVLVDDTSATGNYKVELVLDTALDTKMSSYVNSLENVDIDSTNKIITLIK